MRLPAQGAPRIWHSYLLFWTSGVLSVIWPLAGISFAILTLVLDRRLWRPLCIAVSAICFVAAYGHASLQLHVSAKTMANMPQWADQAINDQPPRIKGNIIYSQWLPGHNLRLLLADVAPVGMSQSALPGLCAWTWQNPPPGISPNPGQIVKITARIHPVRGFANFTAFPYESMAKNTYWRIGTKAEHGQPEILGKPNLLAEIRSKLYACFLAALVPQGAIGAEIDQSRAILAALLFGDRGFLSPETVANFSEATLAHSLALSGQHLCLALFLGAAIAAIAGRFSPGIYLHFPRPALAALASLPFAIIYLWIGNAPASLIRAACMLFIFSLWLWRGYSFNSLDVICSAVALILLFRPLVILDVGFQLSVLCVLVIVLCVPALGTLIPLRKNRPVLRYLDYLKRIAAMSLLIQIFLMPLLISRFGIAGIWFPLNVLWLPLLGCLVLPLDALGLVLSIIPGEIFTNCAAFVLSIAQWPCQIMLDLLHWIRQQNLLAEPLFMRPHWAAFLAFPLLLIIFTVAFRQNGISRKRNWLRACACFTLCLLVTGPLTRLADLCDSTPRITALDVGHGQAVVLRYAPGCRIVIDGGYATSGNDGMGKSIVSPYLAHNASPQLAAVFNTHPDLDHLGGLLYLARKYQPQMFFHNDRESAPIVREIWQSTRNGRNAHTLFAGDEIILGNPARGLRLEVLHPPAIMRKGKAFPDESWAGNGASLVLRLVRNGKGLALFTGDITTQAQELLLENEADLGAKVVFAPHHGSDRNLMADFYRAARADIVIACCGNQTHWRFPGEKLRNFLNKNNIPLLDTGRHGKIEAYLGKNQKPEIAVTLNDD